MEKYKIEYLKNDIPVYVIPLEEVKTVGVSIIVGIGSIYEDKEYRGISHLLEHMMFKSNKKYTSDQINKALELNGGIANAFTSRAITSYLVEVLPEGFPKVIDVLYSMFENDKYIEKEFELEKKVVLSEVEMYENNPEYRIEELVALSSYGKSDYGDPIAGYRKTVENIDKETLEDYKSRYYVANNIKIVLLGNIKQEHIKLLDKTFGELPYNDIKKKSPKKGNKENIIEYKDTKNQIYSSASIVFPLKKIYEIDALTIAISGGLSSIIFNTFREKYGIGYHTHADISDIYPDEFIYSIVTYGYEKEKEDLYSKAMEEVYETLENSDDEYIEGRKKRYKLKLEKLKKDLFNRLFSEARTIWFFNETLEEYYNKVLSIDPRDHVNLVNKLDNYVWAKIYPK